MIWYDNQKISTDSKHLKLYIYDYICIAIIYHHKKITIFSRLIVDRVSSSDNLHKNTIDRHGTAAACSASAPAPSARNAARRPWRWWSRWRTRKRPWRASWRETPTRDTTVVSVKPKENLSRKNLGKMMEIWKNSWLWLWWKSEIWKIMDNGLWSWSNGFTMYNLYKWFNCMLDVMIAESTYLSP